MITEKKEQLEDPDAVLAGREKLSGWVSGTPEPKNNNQEFEEPEEEPGTPVWDLRPVPESSTNPGAGARQRKRMEHIENCGRGVLTEEGLQGSGTIVTFRQGYTYIEHVIACEPIPEREMIPGSDVELSGVFVPLWPIGNPDWIRDPSKLFEQEE